MKVTLKECQFESLEKILLQYHTRNAGKIKSDWHCTIAEGDYFKGDNVQHI
jgi:hypothetical protein